MGNRFHGDEEVDRRESLPDLSRKLYSVHYPIFTYVTDAAGCGLI